jgi:small nuclear ribonucleoprotein (snRNP)-like protein
MATALCCARPVCLQLIELKSGETYNGHLVNVDSWMNIHLREVICTSKVGPVAARLARNSSLPLCSRACQQLSSPTAELVHTVVYLQQKHCIRCYQQHQQQQAQQLRCSVQGYTPAHARI